MENTDKQDKAEDAKTYNSGEEKLLAEEDEMLASVKPQFKQAVQGQLDLIFKELINRTKDNADFEKKVLLEHKSMKRCMKFCSDKAMGLREPTDEEKNAARVNNVPIMTPVGSDMLFEWIEEYYNKDDKAEAEKEKKAAERRKKKTDDLQNKIVNKEKSAKNEHEKPKEKAQKEKQEKPKAASSSKKQDKNVNGQISMFDLLSV